MKLNKIRVKHTILGIHCWHDCPIKEVSFLKNDHHHDFTIVAETTVKHNNRFVEFIMLRISVMKILESYPGQYIKEFGSRSCEMISEEISKKLEKEYKQKFKVSVSEDNVSTGGDW